MGCIVTMNSEKLYKKFLPEIDDTSAFQFITISEDIKTSKKMRNIAPMPSLMPPPQLSKLFNNGEKQEFYDGYARYLQSPSIDFYIAAIVKSVISNDFQLILLCSKSEDEQEYLKILAKYISGVYKMDVFKVKDYLKDPKKINKIKNKEEIEKIVDKKMKKFSKLGIDTNIDPNAQQAVTAKRVKEELSKLDKEDLREIARRQKIKTKGLGRNDLIKAIIKRLSA